MLLFPVVNVLSGQSTIEKYNPELIAAFCDLLDPSRVIIHYSSKTYENLETNKKERWFGVNYAYA